MPDEVVEAPPPEWNAEVAEKIQLMASVGCDRGLMAIRTGLARADIHRLYRAEIKRGLADMKVNILTLQMQVAQKGNVRMLLHLGEVHLGQRLSKAEEGGGGVIPDTTDPTETVHMYIPDNGRMNDGTSSDSAAPVGDGP